MTSEIKVHKIIVDQTATGEIMTCKLKVGKIIIDQTITGKIMTSKIEVAKLSRRVGIVWLKTSV